MAWFTKSAISETVIEPTPTPQEQYEQNRSELRALDQQLAAAERAINEHIRPRKDPRIAFVSQAGKWSMQTRVNAMFMDPTLQRLETNWAALLRKRSATLAEHARLKQLLGAAKEAT